MIRENSGYSFVRLGTLIYVQKNQILARTLLKTRFAIDTRTCFLTQILNIVFQVVGTIVASALNSALHRDDVSVLSHTLRD